MIGTAKGFWAKPKVQSKHFFCLRNNHFGFIDYVNSETRPEGYLEFMFVNEKPELEDGQVIGYEFIVTDTQLKRTYLALSENVAKQMKNEIVEVLPSSDL